LIEEAQSLNPLSIDVTPMALKDIFLEAVGVVKTDAKSEG